ncbi:hypothetical protein [Streptomyces sp. NPDC051684]|uniref:hypothetical protein n=1 Tax=Streptomyces sp. NPDC051684 TaxID=3365670 RepID=UPI00379E1AFB
MRQLPALWFVLSVACALCKAQVARLEFAPPGVVPVSWQSWGLERRASYEHVRTPDSWWLIVESDAYENGIGESLDAADVDRFRVAFRYPRTYAQVHAAGLKGDAGFCSDCDVPYCAHHWRGIDSLGAQCPRGHTR